MAELFVITASNPEANRHYRTTIAYPVSRSLLAQHLSQQEMQMVDNAFANHPIYTWGARPGTKGVSDWLNLLPGDYVLVYVQGRFVRLARVAGLKMRKPELARALWGTEAGETFEYVYFLGNMQIINYALDKFNKDLGYDPTYYPRGFYRVDPQRFELFGNLNGFLASCVLKTKNNRK